MADLCSLKQIKTNTLEATPCQEPVKGKNWDLELDPN